MENENNIESSSVTIEIDYTEEQEALVHLLTQSDNEVETSKHSVFETVFQI